MLSNAIKEEIIYFHKILGTLILTLIFMRLVWRFYNKNPYHKSLPVLHLLLSKIVQSVLYLLLIIIPIQGMLVTWAGGSDVIFLGLYKLPRLVEEDFIMYDIYVNSHFLMTLVLIIFFCFHLLGAFYHRFYVSDVYGVWKSMSLTSKK